MTNQTLLIILIVLLITLKIFWIITDPRPLNRSIKLSLQTNHFISHVLQLFFIIALILEGMSNLTFLRELPLVDTILGLLLFLFGIFLLIWAKITMKDSWGPAEEEHDINRQAVLITTGPYAFSRNPIYMGIFLIYLGLVIAIHSRMIIFCFLQFLYFYKFSLREEKILEKYFGQQYHDYKSKVPRYL
jgi:protein-S-isoprenylcysteine O-methyltransferase Ste14